MIESRCIDVPVPSNNQDWWSVVNAVAGTLSALAALATVIIAVWAYRRARKDKEVDDESKRLTSKCTAVLR